MDLRRQIAIVRASLPLVVLCVVLAAAAAFLVSSVLPRAYEARATLIVGQSLSTANPDYSQLLVSQRLSTTYAAVATKRPILESVIAELGLGVTAADLAERVRADAPLDSTLLVISAQDGDPAKAAAIANAVAEQLIEASPAIQGREAEFQAFIDDELGAMRLQIEATQARLEVLGALTDRTPEQDAEIQLLEGRITSQRATYATLLSFASESSASLLTVIEPAIAPVEPVSPKVLLNTLLAAVLGFVVAGGIAFLGAHLDDSVRDAETVREVTNLSTLGTIARMGNGRNESHRLSPLHDPRSGPAEAYRTLRANVEFAAVDVPLRTLLVTSAMPGEGKTITACNLAIVFAQAGRRVILVDADLRKPGVHVAFELLNGRGLTTMLRGVDMGVDTLTHPTEQPDLRVLTTGPLPPNPAELMGSQRMRVVVDQLLAAADLVVIDSPPLQAVTDSAILSSFVDGTIMVIDAARSHRRSVRAGREALQRAGANVLGAVLNRLAVPRDAGYGYYGGYYGPGTTPPEQVAPPKAATERSRS